MNYLRKLGLIALLFGFISIGFVVTASAQYYPGRWYGDGRYSDRSYRRDRDRRWRYRSWRDDDDDRRRYRRYRNRNSGYGILGSIIGYPNYGYSNNYYYGNSRRYEKERRKAWKRYQKTQRRAYRNYYRDSRWRY